MRRIRSHPLIAWLFLIWFGLSNTVFAGGLVVCHDGHGGSRIEWGCDRNATAECMTSCGSDSADEDRNAPHPCQDTPLGDNQQITKAPSRSAQDVTVLISVAVAALVLWADVQQPTSVVWSGPEPQRSSDALRCIRTVVLLV